ncbi:50S ribosomal protein L13 [Candidatus Falkowbacteria bacterium CG10_big_fil_rev_8_21_14_0_10_37_18]|uniref:Large ribosomal subunit protein uL13 n=1 Tax=Candidatus Falkowbacteria bacterium CG10_big_fil_rev_8_21_14_0_10_37_18 TaxID=1974562 RepID=A0A2H0V8V3_9BACT|nr:MAG: 50S ribosomal protein L13 [Candidatus Falkowbacteria bacterium CG10_big_fil_rev_8_21_14_0_10_37_18]
MKNIERKLHKLDATGQAVGRLATQVATLLRGKNKPEFQAHMDLGDIVEVSNISQVKFTGKKLDQKQYYRYTGYLGGLRSKNMSEVFEKNPGDVLRRAVTQMLPPTKLRTAMIKRLIIK